ncbi:MAG: CRISPR-associated endonuclease Cas6 [Euryarchaeota archaeon]|nr:CRISPR-associated endonuclease Cas6 [Euryarchaeota archaeon]
MHLKTLRLTLKSDRPVEASAAKLRGFFATRFNEYALLHQHIDVDKLLYRYPRIQYKIIDGAAIVLGIEEGAEVLKEIYDKYDTIQLGENVYTIVERGITLKEEEFGIATEILSYEFITPWIALSQNNYQRYLESKREQRRELLRRTLIGNILSASKGLDYVVLDDIRLEIGRLRRRKCVIKGTPFIGLLGVFMVNFTIPDFMGLGKSVSRGFGTVKRVIRK